MSQKKVLKALIDLSLKKTEAKIYFYLSKRGPQQAHEITKALKMKKQQLYPLIKNLQNKAIIESSLDRPAKFSVIPFEKVLDLFAKARMEEAKTIQSSKNQLLSDWQSITLPPLKKRSTFFNVIKGRKYVYSKIQQMLQETTNQFCAITDLSELIRLEQFGILDAIQNNSKKSDIKSRIITEVQKNYLKAIKKLSKSIDPQIELKSLNINIGSSIAPIMVIRDNEEILYFISEKISESGKQNEYKCLFTNCTSIVGPLSNVFKELWQTCTKIEEKIREIETGTLPEKTLVIKDIDEAQTKYYEVLKTTKKEILIVTSVDGLCDFQKTLPKIKAMTGQNFSIRIMSPITKKNLEAANKLLNNSQVRHIPQGYLDTIIVDNVHLFQFADPSSLINGVEKKQNFKNTFYTNNPKYVTKTKKMLENIWRNSSNISAASLESVFDPLEALSLHSKSGSNDPYSKLIFDHLKRQPVVSRTSPGDVTEEEVVDKIIDINYSKGAPGKSVKCYCKIGYAAIDPPSQFNLPKMLIAATQIDKKSSFGAEDRLIFHIWQKDHEGFRYVPVAIIGDNPNFPIETLNKGQYSNTPAANNFHLVKKEEIQFQIYGNTFLANWTIPITLSKKITLPPSTIILEAYGKVKTKRVVLRYPTGAKYNIFYNAFDSFVTYMHESTKYSGPSSDGLFLRDALVEIFYPNQKSYNLSIS